jgi:hypothetical protein
MKGILTTSFLNEPESQSKKGRRERDRDKNESEVQAIAPAKGGTRNVPPVPAPVFCLTSALSYSTGTGETPAVPGKSTTLVASTS